MSHRVLALLAGLCLVLAASVSATAAETDDVAAILKKYNVQEAPTPVRERNDWRPPRKLVALAASIPPPERATLARILPGVKIVYARDVASAAREAVDADIVSGITAPPGICDPRIINNAKQLRWILAMSAGVERCIAVPSVLSRNVLITNLRGLGSAAIGEHAIALALALARGLDTFITDQASSRWSPQDARASHMETLAGKTLLVVGLGGIGTEVASRAHGLGMKVIATRNRGHEGPDYVSHVGGPDELLQLASTADVVVNAAPLTDETRGIFNAKFFSAMKPTAYFINVARGGSVVTDDLVAALNSGKIGGAGLDVVDPEPLPPNHPLWHAKNVIITPHISGSSDIPNEAIWVVVNENLRRYAAGEKMLSVVDLKREY
ncbi:MAG TPA: D-2-hydroxyacid dehydrogenase [Steroidobacteraceae bacterium]|nr:D-2-hydroxyacid dehydrogenase [Steroidobacteraceae bacterium]